MHPSNLIDAKKALIIWREIWNRFGTRLKPGGTGVSPVCFNASIQSVTIQ